jgi:cytochrome c
MQSTHQAPLPEGGGAEGGVGRPEIYVMGCRNPFRISFDSRRKLLFWGEVGPDSGEPDSMRGPAGHDEVNRAKQAGFFGWPLFVGNSKPYRRYDFKTNTPGPHFDPQQPINASPNNTGSRVLPPVQDAFIWYPYDDSPEFPLVGKGGRNAMAGPVYYVDQYPAASRFPDYYDGKLITYDWMRNWIMAITIDSLGNFSRMEPMADSVELSRPMDMIVDPTTGSIWLLEYGTQWFSSNPDARLSRIDYVRGNRPPQARLQASTTAGGAPLTVVFSAAGSRDYDEDRLQYILNFDDGSEPLEFHARPGRSLRAAAPSQPPLKGEERAWSHADGEAEGDESGAAPRPDSIAHTFAQAGTYEVQLTVTDPKGKRSVAKQTIRVGNEPPVVHWDFGGRNRSFYQPGDTVRFRVRVEDAEDGSLERGSISPKAVATSVDYLETGFDITQIAQGHQEARQQAEYSRGKVLIDKSDCNTCHALDRAINGPSFQAVAERYRGNQFAVRNLSLKVRKGGAGNWGQTVMSAHPQVSEEDAGEMVRWILSLGGPPKPKQTLDVQGSYTFTVPPPKKGEKPNPGAFIWYAAYRDQGSPQQDALERAETLLLRPTFLQAERADSLSKGVQAFSIDNGDTTVLRDLKHRSFFVIKHVDLTGIHTVVLGLGTGNARFPGGGGRVEVRLGSPQGELLSTADIQSYEPKEKMDIYEVNLPLKPVADTGRFYDLCFVFRNEGNPSQNITVVDWLRFDLKR